MEQHTQKPNKITQTSNNDTTRKTTIQNTNHINSTHDNKTMKAIIITMLVIVIVRTMIIWIPSYQIDTLYDNSSDDDTQDDTENGPNDERRMTLITMRGVLMVVRMTRTANTRIIWIRSYQFDTLYGNRSDDDTIHWVNTHNTHNKNSNNKHTPQTIIEPIETTHI